MPAPYSPDTTANELVRDYADIIKGKVVLVTGVTPGSLGAEFAESVAKGAPSLLILAGRSVEKTQQTADVITAAPLDTLVRVLQLDLASLSAVREAAKATNSWTDVPQIDVLVNNAGLMAVDHKQTVDGFESQFGVNHLGHFLFTNLIINKILVSKSPRVVNISSDGHRLNPIRWADYNFRVCLPGPCNMHI
jgi:NAD(P)-dependent dehydrogenase (short-subunit alcohol dehydrogenase family)